MIAGMQHDIARLFTAAIFAAGLWGQTDKPALPVNYEEAKVGSYTLPDPLTLANGKKVKDARTWTTKRRPEILELFRKNMQGHSPGRPSGMTFDVFEKATPARNGKAIRKQVTVCFSAGKAGPKMDLLVYTPAAATKPVPLLLYISFSANSLTVDDPGVKEGEIWNREKKKVPASQGRAIGKLPVDQILDHGFGAATVYYGDIEPDFNGGMKYGVRSLYLKPGQTEPAADEWGAIGAWAWGLSRALDYLETDPQVDAKRVAIMGISRLGKTVLWAGAEDPRFAMVIDCCSGEGGASLSKRNYGETVKHLNTNFPYWFDRNYLDYGDHVDRLPFDAHMLMALTAPRPLYLSTGDQDKWADPRGEFLAAVAASPVYELLGKEGLRTDKMPAAGESIMHTIGYHMHAGGHGTIPSDWDYYLKFMEMHLKP